jgi:hypothetical protein
MFNNCFRDYAVKNALEMKELLGIGGSVDSGEQKGLDLDQGF